ncbi:MAG: hypothetical protein ABJA20_09635, partial [Novosphingobium sp.]
IAAKEIPCDSIRSKTALNGDGNLWASLWLAVSPVTVTLPIVLGSCVLVGLPTAWCLKFFGAERKGNYLFAGAMWGFAIPLLILLYMGAQEGWWLALLGSFSGGVTAATWWRSIQQS